jgi:hypothetical protein
MRTVMRSLTVRKCRSSRPWLTGRSSSSASSSDSGATAPGTREVNGAGTRGAADARWGSFLAMSITAPTNSWYLPCVHAARPNALLRKAGGRAGTPCVEVLNKDVVLLVRRDLQVVLGEEQRNG